MLWRGKVEQPLRPGSRGLRVNFAKASSCDGEVALAHALGDHRIRGTPTKASSRYLNMPRSGHRALPVPLTVAGTAALISVTASGQSAAE